MVGLITKSYKKELRNRAPTLKKNFKAVFVDTGRNIFSKKSNNNKKGLSVLEGSGITLKNNEAKYIINVIKYLENRRILVKGTTKN